MTELKPCPFCGKMPRVEESARFPRYGKDEGKRIKGYTVVCQNMYCILHNEDNWYRRSAKEAHEAWNHRTEPEMRPLTLEEVRAHCAKGPDAEPLWAEFKEECAISRWIFAVIPPDVIDRPVLSEWIATDRSEKYGKEWRCWPRKPTPEQMAAEKWEE
nr:MAG TPA: restriction alleviation protein [Caudoviricetes sp.]